MNGQRESGKSMLAAQDDDDDDDYDKVQALHRM